MNVLTRILFFFLLSATLFGASSASAQFISSGGNGSDSLVFYPEKGGQPNTWDYKVYNRNSSHAGINQILISISPQSAQTDHITFIDQNLGSPCGTYDPATSEGWVSLVGSANTTVTDTMLNGRLIGWPLGDSTFYISYSDSAQQKSTNMTWTTIHINGNGSQYQVSSGNVSLFTRFDQSLYTLDTAWGSSSILPSCDASFNFTLRDRNDFQAPIDGVRLQLADAASGFSLRPSGVIAPPGWVVDSVTESAAYFHATEGAIGPAQSQGGFIVTARTSSTQSQNFFWEWTAYNSGTHIDYDTVAFLGVKPSCIQTTYPSSDTLVVSNLGGRAYNVTLENFHVSKSQAASPIKSLSISTSSPGVSFESVRNSPPGWYVLFGPGNTSLQSYASDSTHDLPSGISNSLTLLLNNANSGTPLTLNWSATDASGVVVSTGMTTLTCAVPPKQPTDTVTFALTTNCKYVATDSNRHNYPNPTLDKLVTYWVHPPNSFSATPKPGSSLGWKYGLVGDTVLTFFPSGSDTNTYMAQYETQNDTFTVSAANPNQPFWIYYRIQDATGQITTGPDSAMLQCTPPPPPCDTVTFTRSKTDCADTIAVKNARPSSQGSVTQIIVVPQTGWKICQAGAAFGTSVNITSARDSVTFSPAGGIPPGVKAGGMWVIYDGPAGPFDVNVATVNSTGSPIACSYTDVITTTCGTCQLSVVAPIVQESLTLTAYPNPFSRQTEVSFSLPQFENVQIILTDVMGRTVKMLNNSSMGTGDHTLSLDAAGLPTGTYYLRLETPFSRTTKKLVIE